MEIYFLPRGNRRLHDIAAACNLLKEAYPVKQSGLAPLPGFLFAVEGEVSGEDMDVLGIVKWE